MRHRFLHVVVTCGFITTALSEDLPDPTLTFIENNCLECHDEATQKGEINLDFFEVDWSDKDSIHLWERVLNAVDKGEMPPEKKPRPKPGKQQQFLAWLDQALTEHTPIGGTLARRLNQSEYKTTVQKLFDLKGFQLPTGFPADREYHGFDNVGEGLVLSPPLLQAYSETARLVADQLFPPPTPPAEKQSSSAGVDELVISYSSGKVVGDALRLGMNCNPIWRSSTWPTRIETHAAGIYRITVELSTFRPAPDAPPMIAKIFARDLSSPDGISKKTLRVLKEIKVTSESPETYTFEAALYERQTPVIHWENAPFCSDRNNESHLLAYFEKRDFEIPGYLAAWNEMVNESGGRQGFRGGVGWERVKKKLERDDLPEISEKDRAKFLKAAAGNPVLYAETVVFDVYDNGPALEVHGLKLEGPLRPVDSPEDKERKRLQNKFFGEDRNPESVIRRFLSSAFRRPADDETVQSYLAMHDRHIAAGHTPDEAMHLIIRSALISPRFLYRSLTDGPLDDYDLATRLSYFLTGAPPADRLIEKAEQGKLTDPEVLYFQSKRLLPGNAAAPFVRNFTGQWLDTRLLPEIMPDPKFKFKTKDADSAREEVEHLFFEILKENRPMTDFIDPDFAFTSSRLAQHVYGLKEGYRKGGGYIIQRIPLPRGGRYGGVLGNSAVMMATANGVDTQPVLRGVWVLENILGTPPPPPPKSVPALTPDTRGATTPRDLLTAHTSDENCAGCHKRIDPVGFVLENFDPVGAWRDNWPGIDKPIDASSTLPDGTEINDIVDFKKWLVQNIDQFSECLAGHLMTYATGRVPNYSERKEIAAIVKANHETGNGFRDLLLALIQSETFRTK